MLVKIINLVPAQKEAGETQVEFVSKIGGAIGYWRYSIPVVDRAYHVEFDIADKLIWGVNIVEAASQETSLSYNSQQTVLQGLLTSVEEDCSVLDLDGSLLLFEANGEAFSPGIYINIVAEHLLLSDINL